jgi:hypothetical protein
MINGAVIFAHNNTSVDYIKLAVFAANRVKQYLELPVSLITDNKKWLDQNFSNHPFDQIIEIAPSSDLQSKQFNDGTLSSKMLEWKNFTRSQIYDLTPYDRTLVLDSDYIINSPVLKSAFLNEYDFQIYKTSLDLSGWRDGAEFQRVSKYSIPFYWATAFVFQKNTITESFFNLVEYIKINWIYFKTLYAIDAPTFRNDYAFSIAIHIMNGKTDGNFAMELPGKMVYTIDRDILIDANNNSMKFLVEKKDYLGEYTAVKTQGLDVHVMNKFSLTRYIDEVTSE